MTTSHSLYSMLTLVCVTMLTAFQGGSHTLAYAAEEPVTLELWSHWGGEAVKMRFVEETIRDFEAANPHITVKLTWIKKNRMNQGLRVSLPKGLGPDIFYAEPYPFQAHPWVVGGYLLDLNERLDWSRFQPSAYQLLWEYPDGGIYGVPIELAEYAIYYNKDLFAKAGLHIPESGHFDEKTFLELVTIFRKHGIIPIAIGNQDRGEASNMLFQGLLLRFAGTEKLRGLMTDETSWTDPDIVKAFSYMKQLVDASIFPENMSRLKYQQGRELFVRGKAAMYVEGTWFFGKIASKDGTLPLKLQGKLGAMDYPTVTGGKGNKAAERITGGSYVIRKNSPHIKEAVQFLDFMTSRENGLKWIQYTQSPMGVDVSFAETVSKPFLQELLSARGQITDYLTPGTMFLLNSEEVKVWIRDIGISFMGGNLSVEEAVNRLEHAAHQ